MQLQYTVNKRHAGQTLLWLPADREELWNEHLKDYNKRRLLERLGWGPTSITYKFNAHGFRSDEFEGDGALFLGCSFTIGIGMDWERTWAYKVASALGLKCWNLGLGGGSNDTAFRMARHWVPLLKPKHVFLFPPPHSRIELAIDGRFKNHLPNMHSDLQYYRQWLLEDANSMLNQEKNIMAIQHICASNDIPLTVLDDWKRWNMVEKDDYARDLLHCGPKWNEHIANQFLQKIGA